MDKAFADKWVAALRSGEFKQAKGCLHDGSGYCCLGVAEVTAGSAFEPNNYGNYGVVDDGEVGVLTTRTQAVADISDDCGSPYDGDGIKVGKFTYLTLIDANDGGRTFAEIADAIEQNWERL